MAARKIDFLRRPEAPCAHHEERAQPHKDQPGNGDPPRFNRIGAKKMDRGCEQACRCWNGHADKIFAVRPAGIARLRIVAHVEPGKTRRAAKQKKKRNECPGLQKMLVNGGVGRIGQKTESPYEGQQAWRHAKRNHIGQRVELLAEVGRSVGHSGNAAVKRIEGNGKEDGDSRPVEVDLCIVGNGIEGLGNREVACAETSGRKQRGQKIHAAAQPGPVSCARLLRIEVVHAPSLSATSGRTLAEAERSDLRTGTAMVASSISASTVAPPFTLSPTFTLRAASAGTMTSTLEPNLMRPTRCPRSTLSPAFKLNTMRRASRPAICLKTTSMPSSLPWPLTVTIFCSFWSAELGFMAFKYLPFW